MGIRYELRLVKDLHDADGNEVWGDTDSENYIITLVDGPRKRVNRTLCHEIVHVWQDMQGRDFDEAEATRFEVALFDMFNQEELIEFLQKRAW